MTFEDIMGIKKRINVLDLGAKCYLSDKQNYDALSDIYVCGVDYFSDQDSLDEHRQYDQVINAVIGDGTPQTLYITEYESCSSLFEPNHPLLAQYQTLSEWLTVKEAVPVDTIRLNDLSVEKVPDYIKSDIQGADALAIQYGDRFFGAALVVEVEVEFIPQYQNQPLFSEVEQLLRAQGYMFHTFTGYGSRMLKPADNPYDPYDTFNQWMWSHAVFIKDLHTASLTSEEYVKLAMIAHNVYQSYDIALHCLQQSEVESAPYHAFLLQEFDNETLKFSDL
ncbi:FkbM family methyltransferase [Vibrio sp. La 4.2.2]|uniref:FkbM family methyltransferase n=1 Tax=Vibrio sp. La 4.2.2 TaxID=2998830 RepID=UPI0022CDD665|nr:FkbM family methyltransferase [Vibrio sp. La 4.2.2]MDA0107817.1 FkbM family methyltransferase [Vibrio sp. La 4.2.2]